MKKNSLAIFESFKIRRYWDEKTETWFFSVVDIVGLLTESSNPTDYLKKLRKRDVELGKYLGTNCPQVEMITDTGKKRKTLAGNTEQILRLIQSVPSKKAEPVKLWLAKVGTERIAEIQDPSLGVNRARELWKKHGRSEKWIQQRMMGQETRNKLTDYWKESGVKEGDEYAILTNIIHQEWADLNVQDHKDLKNLKKSHNLRDHMNEAELILTALAELSTRQIAESMETKGLTQNKIPAKKGGQVAKNARKELESKTGKSVITGENFLPSSRRNG
jgi:hypothetical protein